MVSHSPWIARGGGGLGDTSKSWCGGHHMDFLLRFFFISWPPAVQVGFRVLLRVW